MPTTPEVPWWHDAVVYQIYPRSFADSNGDGVGDLRGIISKLDYLADLGVDALWLSPICVSPMADFGYDVADYCDVDPLFGDLAAIDELIAGLHKRGMRLLLDWVPNHTSDQHEWFVDARSAPTSAHRDWYVWRDPKPDGSPPTNWIAAFSDDPAWTYDQATDQYYLHLFLPEQPDLNWSNPEVVDAMHAVLRFWLDRGIDGFRADVVHLIGKGTDVSDLPPDLARVPVLALDRPETHAHLRQIRSLLDGYDHDPMMVGEVYLLEPGQAATYLGEPELGRGELHLSFDFRPMHIPWDPTHLAATLRAVQTDFAEPRWPTWVLGNHDQPRQRRRYGTDARARATAVVSLTVRGTPFLYAGEELGLDDGDVSAARQVDPGGRDGCRAPIPWLTEGDGTTGHGWVGATPWLPFPANAATNNAEVLVGTPDSIHGLYRDLLALRKQRPALRRGTMDVVDSGADVVRYERVLDAERLVVVVNLGHADLALPNDLTDAPVVISSIADRSTDATTIASDEAVVFDLSL